jgi:putative membrane protein
MSPTKTNASPAPAFTTPLNVVVGIIAISAAASGFLVWLVYKHQPSDAAQTHLLFLPALNAILNTCCTIALLIGFNHIWNRRIVKHRNAMFAAFIFSSLFLASYITNHALHGDARFPVSHPIARVIYLWVLLTPHILASVVALPMILITFFFSLTGRFPLHRRIAKYTFPLWLYVSVSGVFVYGMLALYR